MNIFITILLIFTFISCSTSNQTIWNKRQVASVLPPLDSKSKIHLPFFKILFNGQAQDTRLNKKQTMRLINRSSSKVCAKEFLKRMLHVYITKDIRMKIDDLYNQYGVAIHVGGIYTDSGGKIQFDQIVQAHVPNTDYHRYNNYLYQVRNVGLKNLEKQETILDESGDTKIVFKVPDCEVDRVDSNTYLKMLNLVENNISNAIKELNKRQIEESPLSDVLQKYY